MHDLTLLKALKVTAIGVGGAFGVAVLEHVITAAQQVQEMPALPWVGVVALVTSVGSYQRMRGRQDELARNQEQENKRHAARLSSLEAIMGRVATKLGVDVSDLRPKE